MGKTTNDMQLERMQHLMEYTTPKRQNKSSVEYFTEGADGKVYGIVKEGSKYFIKTALKGNEYITESYDYIGGFQYRHENAYDSYNVAKKQLGLKMISLNEAYDVKASVEGKQMKKHGVVAESVRKEIERMNQIFENSGNIGKYNSEDPGKPKGIASASDPKQQGDPFGEGEQKITEPEDNEKVPEAKDPKTVGDGKDASKVDVTKADKMAKGGTSKNDYKDATNVPEGSVANQKPAGAKAVKMNEETEFGTDFDEELEDEPVDDIVADDEFVDDEPVEEEPEIEDTVAGIDADNEEEAEGNALSDYVDEYPTMFEPKYGENELFENIDRLLNEIECEDNGDKEALDGPHGSDKKIATKDSPIKDNAKAEDEEALDGPHGSLNVQSWDKMNEAQIARQLSPIVNRICENLLGKNKKKVVKESLQQKIQRMVNEEVDRLNVYGKHPRYGQEPFTTPENREKNVNKGDKDWNHSSVKGNNRYGQRIGNGAPFNLDVDVLTDAVVNMVKKSLSEN